MKKFSQKPEPMNVDSPSPPPASPKKPQETKAPPPPALETDAQKAIRADKVKEQGNTAFKAKKFDNAIELYTKAIGMSYQQNPTTLFADILHRNTARPSLSHEPRSILHGYKKI
jgi:hypothetical protein